MSDRDSLEEIERVVVVFTVVVVLLFLWVAVMGGVGPSDDQPTATTSTTEVES